MIIATIFAEYFFKEGSLVMWLYQATEPAQQATEWFRDPVWQFVGVILAIVAILVSAIVSLYIFFRQNKRKTLFYDIRSYVPLLNVDSQVKDKLQITYNGKVVNDLKLLVIRLQNDGDIPIESGDFDENVSIEVGESAEILISEISSTQPKEMKAKVYSERNRAILQPLLLNQTDWVEIKLIVAGASSDPKIAGRIVGVKSIRTTRKNSLNVMYSIIYTMTGIVTILALSLGIQGTQGRSIPESLIITITVIISIVGVVTQLYVQRKSSKNYDE